MNQYSLKSLRERADLTQEELANQLSISLPLLQNLEEDSSKISDTNLEKYLAYFHVQYDEIFFGTEFEQVNLLQHPAV